MTTAATPFSKVPATADFPALEREMLALWQELDAFHESNRRRAGGQEFVFYDGPPFATGTPHYGHLLAGTIKDIVPRYWNMRGHRVARRFGWDCHGLPIEALAQEAMGLAGAAAIREAGVERFNAQCCSMVQTYVGEWRRTVTRMGRWVDFDDDYKTMDLSFMESVWWIFRRLWDQGRIYRAHRIMPYSWALTTPLSNFEANSNYKEVQDPAITLRFRVTSGHEAIAQGRALSLLAWTTTPWTLPANLALCVGPDIDYVVLSDGDELLLLAEARLAACYPTGAPEILARLRGAELAGWTYKPLFDWYAEQPAFRVLSDGFVSTADGTGIVHLAPAYGEDDYRVCRAAGLALVDPLDDEARFQAPAPATFRGRFCKDCDKDLIRQLKESGLLVHQSTTVHSYPFCERTDTPLIYRAIDAWYVRVEDLRERLVALNEDITWVPAAVGEKRFGNWLREAKDWNISRNRFWGSCLPVWVNVDDPSDCICVGSVAELEQLAGLPAGSVSDLHKQVLDGIEITRDGRRYRRTPEVLDCWFESGSMPLAQHHYPFAPDQELAAIFPAHFIAEGLDQTRGWFYTLLVLGTALFDASPYRSVVVNGLILAEDGQKMSKRKKNYPDPVEVIERHGADALRAYMIDSPVVRGEPLRFSEKGLKDIVRNVVLPYWNALSFFTTYAVVDGYDPRSWSQPPVATRSDLDRWILSTLQSLVREVNNEMEGYRLYNVVPRLVAFIDDLTNWYVRSSRRRFWKSEDDADKAAAYATLYEVLTCFARVLAPFMPFLTEAVHQRLVRPVDAQAPASVHWCDYPQVEASLIDPELEQRMTLIRAAVGLGRKLREERRIRVRQPLAQLTVIHRDPRLREAITRGSSRIADELNVKTVAVEADEAAFCTVTIKPNFASLRARCPQQLGPIAAALRSWSFAEVERLERGERIAVADQDLSLADVLLERKPREGLAVASDGQLAVALDTALTPALAAEGLARDAISLIQNARKEAGLEVADRIHVHWHSPDASLAEALRSHAQAIAAEVLALTFAESDTIQGPEQRIEDKTLQLSIQRA